METAPPEIINHYLKSLMIYSMYTVACKTNVVHADTKQTTFASLLWQHTH